MDENFILCSTSTSITVAWHGQFANEIAASNTIKSYAIKFKVEGATRFDDKHVPIRKEEEYEVEITDLKSSTLYVINVYWCNEDEEPTALFKTKFSTGESNLKFLMKTASSDKTNDPVIYQLKPVSKIEHEVEIEHDTGHYVDCIRILNMIVERRPNIHSSEEKSVLLLGGTGTGKSTMIDALMNFIAGVSYTDNYRFRLIYKTQLEKEREEKQFQSQTSSVTVYRIPKMKGLKISCGVNIIDTPGFNDTRKDFDKRITAQIKELFVSGINHLDAILVVLPLSTTRLTDGQAHIFSSILDMFGDDIRDNIFVTLTHDDSGDEHQCLSLLQNAGVPYTKSFRFNNAHIFSEFKSSDKKVNMAFWKTRTDNFADLFKNLETTRMTSIKSSIAIMRARTMLEIQLKALEDVLSQQAQYIANYKEDKSVIQAIENESPENKKILKYRRTVPETREKKTYRESLNCPKCRKTCHKRCWVLVNKLGWICEAMVDGKCTICDGKCDAKDHELSRKLYEVHYVTTVCSGEDVKARHDKRQETFNIFQNTINLIEQCITEINSTALKKNALSATEYIQNLTNKEKKKKGEGYEMRVQILENVSKHLKQHSTSNLAMEYLMEN